MKVFHILIIIGKYISICSIDGSVSVWKLPFQMSTNIIKIQEELKRNSKFWDNFGISYYQDHL